MSSTEIAGRIIGTILLLMGALSLWLDCKARERRRR